MVVRRSAPLFLAVVLVAGALVEARAAESERRLPPRGTRGVVYVALGDSTVEGIGASTPERNYPSRMAAKLRDLYPDVAVTIELDKLAPPCPGVPAACGIRLTRRPRDAG